MTFKNGVYQLLFIAMPSTDSSHPLNTDRFNGPWHVRFNDKIIAKCQRYTFHTQLRKKREHDWNEKRSIHQLRRDEIHIVGIDSVTVCSRFRPLWCPSVEWVTVCYRLTVLCLHLSVLYCCYRHCWKWIEYVIKINGSHICLPFW